MKCARCRSPHTVRERRPAHIGDWGTTTIENYVLKCTMCRNVQLLGMTDPFVHKMTLNLARMRRARARIAKAGKYCGSMDRAIRSQEDLLSNVKLQKGF